MLFRAAGRVFRAGARRVLVFALARPLALPEPALRFVERALLFTGRAFLLPRFFAFPGVMALTARFATGIAARAVLAATLASRAGTFAAGRVRGRAPNKKAPEFPQALFENCCS